MKKGIKCKFEMHHVLIVAEGKGRGVKGKDSWRIPSTKREWKYARKCNYW